MEVTLVLESIEENSKNFFKKRKEKEDFLQKMSIYTPVLKRSIKERMKLRDLYPATNGTL